MKFSFSGRLSLVCLALVLLLSACGFHVRGAQRLPFRSLHIGMSDQSEMGAAIRRQVLASGDTKLAATSAEAEAVLTVVLDRREKTILSLNSAGRVREFLLTQRFVFALRDPKGRDLLPQTELRVTRDMSYSDTDLLAKDAEEALLYRDMQYDLVDQIMRRMAVAQLQVQAN